MSQQEQPVQGISKINFMRSALDKQSSTVDFTLPNNRIIKIRKIDPSTLNITDEEKDRIYENHQEGSPIFILKRRVNDNFDEPADSEKIKSKITIRRVIKNKFERESNSLSQDDNESTVVKKLVVGNVLKVYENTRDEQTNTVVKSFVFVPAQETYNNNTRARSIQIENDIDDLNNNKNSSNN